MATKMAVGITRWFQQSAWAFAALIVVLGLAQLGCERKPPRPADKPPDKMAYLHVQLAGQPRDQWTQIVDAERFTQFEKLLEELSETADIARPDISSPLVGLFYARSESRIETKFLLRKDGSLKYGHLEALLNEQQYEILLSILQAAKPKDSEEEGP